MSERVPSARVGSAKATDRPASSARVASASARPASSRSVKEESQPEAAVNVEAVETIQVFLHFFFQIKSSENFKFINIRKQKNLHQKVDINYLKFIIFKIIFILLLIIF